MLDVLLPVAVLVAVATSFFVSAAAGLGGSLILVPALALVLGTKEGIALAALLLAANNVVKTVVYRKSVPVRAAAALICLTIVGTFLGARLLVAVPDKLATVAVIGSFAVALTAERRELPRRDVVLAPGLALASGAMSGFSGTSGPLKGVAIRSLGLDRLHTVGAAALVSLAGDLTKTAVFADARLLGSSSLAIALSAAPIMILATLAGRRFTTAIGERGFQRLFWLVMGGYTARLLLVAF